MARDDESRAAVEALKDALKEGLQVFQLEPDQHFVLCTDASDFAIGAVLEQERNEELVPVSFFSSRKLVQSQLNWNPREMETYAIVAALRKWAGRVGFQTVWSKLTISRSNTGSLKISIPHLDQEGVVLVGTKPSLNLIWRYNICQGKIIP